jgi:bacteriocin biosynthesis cyclodehydratase domain-containing protein
MSIERTTQPSIARVCTMASQARILRGDAVAALTAVLTRGGQVTDTVTGGVQPATDMRIGTNPGARVEVTKDAVLVRHGDHITKLRGDRLPAFVQALLTTLLDSPTTLDIAAVTDRAQLVALESVLAQLVNAALLERGDAADDLATASSSAIGMWLRVSRTVPLRTIQTRMDTACCTVLGTGNLAERIATELTVAGTRIVVTSSPEDVPSTDDPVRDVVVVVGDTEKDPVLQQWNGLALASGRTWLPALPFDGHRAVVGPWTRPGRSACFTCYQLRRAATFPDPAITDDLVAARPVRTGGDRAALVPGVALMQTGLVVERVVEWIALSETNAGLAVPGSLDTVEVTSDGMRLRNHRLFRVPRCSTCSPARDTGYPMIWFHRNGQPA